MLEALPARRKDVYPSSKAFQDQPDRQCGWRNRSTGQETLRNRLCERDLCADNFKFHKIKINSFITLIYVINSRQKNLSQVDTGFTSRLYESFSLCSMKRFMGKEKQLLVIISNY